MDPARGAYIPLPAICGSERPVGHGFVDRKEQRLSRKLLVSVLAIVLTLGTGGVANAQSNSFPAGEASGARSVGALQETQQLFPLVFKDAEQVYTFSVATSDKKTKLLVDTLDCCIPGDKWGVRIFATKEKKDGEVKKVRQVAEACGTGSITDFSGEATATKSETYIVEVFYCEGVDIFPAGMVVRFRYEDGTGVAAPTGTCQDPDKSCQEEGKGKDKEEE